MAPTLFYRGVMHQALSEALWATLKLNNCVVNKFAKVVARVFLYSLSRFVSVSAILHAVHGKGRR